ncbi:hypothetical protein MAR_026028, partial [Mya arenaria]
MWSTTYKIPTRYKTLSLTLKMVTFFKYENELKEIMNNTNEVKKRLHTIDKKLNMVHEHQTNTFRTMQWIVIATCMVVLAAVLVGVNLPALQTIIKRSQFQPPMEKTASIVILTIALLYMQPWLQMIFTRPQIKPNGEKTGCLQDYSPLFQTSTIFVDYFKHHGPLVGRVWMFQLLDEQLKNTKKNGILLEADMGYGKSAIAAHIICSKEGDQGMEMRKRLIAFHICKFDAKKTYQAGFFIQRLVSMISNNIPEFNETINDCLHSFNTEQCDSD